MPQNITYAVKNTLKNLRKEIFKVTFHTYNRNILPIKFIRFKISVFYDVGFEKLSK